MTPEERRSIDEALARFELIAGAGSEADQKACVMTLLAWVAGREWTDHPPCASPLIARNAIRVNDARETTPDMRAALVRLGELGILDTWWVPDIVVAAGLVLVEGEEISDYERVSHMLGFVAKWKLDKGLPPDLSGAVLSGAVLSDAVLSGADLRRAVLSGAVLSGAVLSGADLRRAYGKPYGDMPSGWKLSDGGLWVKA